MAGAVKATLKHIISIVRPNHVQKRLKTNVGRLLAKIVVGKSSIRIGSEDLMHLMAKSDSQWSKSYSGTNYHPILTCFDIWARFV